MLKKIAIVLLFISFLVGACSSPKARRPISQKTTTFVSEVIEQSRKLNDLENKEIKTYMRLDSTHRYQTAPHGFWYYYEVKKEEDTPTPTPGDVVSFTYDIKNLDDTIIYSKEELGVKTYRVDNEEFISGLQEGIKRMKVGEMITFVIPSYRAFGIVGDGNKIKSNQTIKSTITLLNIKQKEK